MIRFTTIARTTARTGTLIAAASGLLALTVPAVAAPSEDALPQGKLNIAGTDFTSAKSVDHLKARVRRVAYAICVPDGGRQLPIPSDQLKCLNTAIGDGLAQIASRQAQAMRATTVNVASAQTDIRPVH